MIYVLIAFANFNGSICLCEERKNAPARDISWLGFVILAAIFKRGRTAESLRGSPVINNVLFNDYFE